MTLLRQQKKLTHLGYLGRFGVRADRSLKKTASTVFFMIVDERLRLLDDGSRVIQFHFNMTGVPAANDVAADQTDSVGKHRHKF
jgi:hypothetical protein